MNRRRYLAGLSAGVVGALAGCVGAPDAGGGPAADDRGGGGTTPAGRPELPVPESELSRGARKDAIPAIVDPAFGEDWSGIEVERRDEFGNDAGTAEVRLQPDDPVIGVSRAGEARAYPLRILNWHEVVNDSLGGPLLVTYCPLCGSGMTAERTVNGEETVFGVSGLLWRNDLVMYDEATESLWSQILATAIRGEETGTTLTLVPSTLTTWGEWRESHPGTVVLRPPPESHTVVGRVDRDYSRNPYGGYESSRRIGIGGSSFDDDRLHPKAQVVGVTHEGTARAYPLDAVQRAGVVNDEVNGLPVVVAAVDSTLVAYVRVVDGETLDFVADGPKHLRAGGSRWRITTGTAVDGPREGTELEHANDVSPQFWFAWLDFHPETSVYGE
jgi:hypothetical protein